MANQSIYNAFERLWMHITAALGDKADIDDLELKADKEELEGHMAKNDPFGTGTFNMEGTGNFTENVNVQSLSIDSKVNLVSGNGKLEFVFPVAEATSEE